MSELSSEQWHLSAHAESQSELVLTLRLCVMRADCSHYMKVFDAPPPSRPLRSQKAKDLLKHIDAHHGTLAFARRWLDDAGAKGHALAIKELCDMGIVGKHPPLVDNRGAYTAQFEHTFFIKGASKEILSRGDDF